MKKTQKLPPAANRDQGKVMLRVDRNTVILVKPENNNADFLEAYLKKRTAGREEIIERCNYREKRNKTR